MSPRDRAPRRRAGLYRALGLVWLTGSLLAAPAAASHCPGDCNGDSEVTVDEVLRAVAVALGERQLDHCLAADRDGNGTVTVDEVVFALQMALQGCPRRSFQHGMNLASWWRGQFAAPAAAAALDQLAETSIDTVVIVPTWYMESATSSEIFADPFQTSSLEELAIILEEARRRGFRTALKPHIDSRDGVWRGRIAPENLELWFESYERIIVDIATLANAAGCDQLIVATELQSLTGPAYRDRWAQVIGEVRSRYAGELAYAANWDGYALKGIWDLVDVVGINAYFPLSNAADPSFEEILVAWLGDEESGTVGWMQEILAWYGQTFPAGDKRLVFTEVGYLSSDFALRQPWEIEDDCFAAGVPRAPNEGLQARAYQALMQAAGGLDGVFWWHWEPFPVSDAAGQCQFTPQGKAAEAWLRERP